MVYISKEVCKLCQKQKYCISSSRGVQCRDFKKIEKEKENGKNDTEKKGSTNT